MDSYIVDVLNKASWSLEYRIKDLEKELEQVKAERDKWMKLALNSAEQGSVNIINTIVALDKLDQKKNENLPSGK